MKGLQPLALLPAFPRLPVLVCGGGGLGELEGLEENLLFVLEQFIWSPPPLFLFCPGEFRFEANRHTVLKGIL